MPTNCPILSASRDTIIVPACELPLGEAIAFYKVIGLLIPQLNCNVAKPKTFANSLWATCQTIFTIEVDLKILNDVQRLAKIDDSLEASLIELIEFYSDHTSLNIILLPEVLAARPSYTKYTSQLGYSLTQKQDHYRSIKVSFLAEQSRLGIFCRNTKFPSNTFIKQVIFLLNEHGAIFIPTIELPKTYQTNFAMLKQHLKKEFPIGENFELSRLGDGVNILIKDKNKS